MSLRAASIAARCSGVITACALACSLPLGPWRSARSCFSVSSRCFCNACSVWRNFASASLCIWFTRMNGWLVSPRERSPISASPPASVPIRLATNGPLSLNGIAVCWPKKSLTRTQNRSARMSLSATTTRLAGPSVCAL